MTPRDLFGYAAAALTAHKLRSRLTIASVAIGVAAVLLLTTLGASAKDYVVAQFGGIGADIIVAMPGRVETTGGPPLTAIGSGDLTLGDAESIRNRLPAVVDVAPMAITTSPVSAAGRARHVLVIGTTDRWASLIGLEIGLGQNLPALDLEQSAPVCVIGRTVWRELFDAQNPLGETAEIGDSRFRVVGLLAPAGTRFGGINIDDVVIIPVANVLRLTNRRGLHRLMMRVRSVEAIDDAKAAIRAHLIERRDGDEDFTLVTQQSIMSALQAILSLLTLALTAIAGVSLGVAGIGIMNVMLVSVVERTPEIGLAKALGASNRQILALFMAEAGVLALFGGFVGAVTGLLIAAAANAAMPGLEITTPVWAIEASLAIALSVGMLSGVLPARKAARLAPVEALRAKR